MRLRRFSTGLQSILYSDNPLCSHLRTDLVSACLPPARFTYPPILRPHRSCSANPCFCFTERVFLGAYLVCICNHNSFPSTYRTRIAFAFYASDFHRNNVYLPLYPSTCPSFNDPYPPQNHRRKVQIGIDVSGGSCACANMVCGCCVPMYITLNVLSFLFVPRVSIAAIRYCSYVELSPPFLFFLTRL